jgi:2-iminobutanoate/2-iminopropanoate deaminase
MKTIVNTSQAPAAIGPYSQAIRVGNMVFVSGQIPIDPRSGNIESTDIAGQTTQCFKNLKAVLSEAGCQMEHVVKVTVFLADMNLFADMNKVYESQFDGSYPARSAVAVKGLPKGSLVEIEAIASLF